MSFGDNINITNNTMAKINKAFAFDCNHNKKLLDQNES